MECLRKMVLLGVKFWSDNLAVGVGVASLWAGESGRLALVASPERGEPYVVRLEPDDLHDLWATEDVEALVDTETV
jgi:hypothetical protein